MNQNQLQFIIITKIFSLTTKIFHLQSKFFTYPTKISTYNQSFSLTTEIFQSQPKCFHSQPNFFHSQPKCFHSNPYIRLPMNKVAATLCQLLPMAISGSCLCAVFCQWHKYSGKLGQKAAQN